jgi:hypothetical protein
MTAMRPFLAELRRRKRLQGRWQPYAVVAWILLQAASLLLPVSARPNGCSERSCS